MPDETCPETISQSLTMAPSPLPVKVDVGIHCLRKGGIPLPHKQHIWGERIWISHLWRICIPIVWSSRFPQPPPVQCGVLAQGQTDFPRWHKEHPLQTLFLFPKCHHSVGHWGDWNGAIRKALVSKFSIRSSCTLRMGRHLNRIPHRYLLNSKAAAF